MNILGIIPARGGSKGIPRKNIKRLCDKPLIAYSIEAALKSNLSRVVVSSEDEEICRISKRYGSEVLIRPMNLAQDETPTISVLRDVVSRLDDEFDAIMTLQPTSPFRTEKHINEAITLFESDDSADSLVSVVQVPHNMTPLSIMKEENNYLTNYVNQEDLVLRRQDKPVLWARNGAAIYITRAGKIDDYIFGGKIIPYKMNKIDSIDIDDIFDWKLSTLIMSGM